VERDRDALADRPPAAGDFGLEVIDVSSDACRVMTDNIIVTPTLVGNASSRRLVMVGDLITHRSCGTSGGTVRRELTAGPARPSPRQPFI